MAAHRRPKQRNLGGTAARTALTVALAGAATGTLFEGAGHADPGSTPERLKAKADTLYREAEEATERYNGAKEAAAEARTALDGLRDEAARRTARLNAARDALGSIATAQYRAGGIDPAVQLALSSDPDAYLAGAEYAERAGSRQVATLAGIREENRELAQLRAEADGRLAELTARQDELARHRKAVREKLAAAQSVLARMAPAEQVAYASGDSTPPGRADRDDAPGGAVVADAPNPRAAQAIAYAYGALGKPYVWGATGPSAYDCSGLTQAAWRSAGVSLPRTTYTQIDSGHRVPRSQLAPGDLVFFYSGVSHVGLYIGNGQMIHAPRPGAPVRVAPIDEMPFAGATRVA
ncbi:NlpC/P60 family protein [Streptomyces sp. SCSIO 30461]|uniref:C40 family peptidase n=1 Tax=Streptomyces sp. SCSIO 30461 TaxID=3118085 RepID=UPI0030D0AB4F